MTHAGGAVTAVTMPLADFMRLTRLPIVTFSDLNNLEVANLQSKFLEEKGLN